MKDFSRIAICGSHGTGKTTLLEALKKRPYLKRHRFISEVARTVINQMGGKIPTDSKVMRDFQKQILEEQIRQEAQFPLFVSDRSVLDVLAYSAWYLEMGLLEGDLTFLLNPPLGYDILIYVPIEFPLVDDGVRWIDPEGQKRHDEILQEYIAGYSNRYKVVTVSGSTEDRILQIENYLWSDL